MAWIGESRWQKMLRLARTFAANPAVVARALPGEFWQRYGRDQGFDVEEEWEEQLHRLLSSPWPCARREEFHDLMASIRASLSAKGLAYGRQTYAYYSDGDSSLGAAAWCSVLHT